MNTHIVRVNEKIEKIASIYNLSTEEIIKINHHIKDWNNLIPGTKLRFQKLFKLNLIILNHLSKNITLN